MKQNYVTMTMTIGDIEVKHINLYSENKSLNRIWMWVQNTKD